MRRVVLDQAEPLRGQRAEVVGHAVIVVADEQVGGRRGAGRPGHPGDPRGGVGARAAARQRAAGQQQALRHGQERLRRAVAGQGQRRRRGGDLTEPGRPAARLVRAGCRRVRAQDEVLDLPVPRAGHGRVAEQPEAPAGPAGQRAAVAAVPRDRVPGGPLVVRRHRRRARGRRRPGAARAGRHREQGHDDRAGAADRAAPPGREHHGGWDSIRRAAARSGRRRAGTGR